MWRARRSSPVFGVDLGVDVGLAAVARARRLGDRVLHGGDDDAAVDRLLAGDRVGDLQQFKPVGADGHRSFSLVLVRVQRLRVHAIVVIVARIRARLIVARLRSIAPVAPRALCRAAAIRVTSASVSTSRASPCRSIGSSTSAVFARRRVLAPQPRGIAFDPEQDAAEPLAALDRDRHLDLHLVAGVALEIRAAHQRPVDAGRGHLQPVLASIGSSASNTGESAREAASQSSIAIVPSGRSAMICTVQPAVAGDAHAHQPIAETVQHRRRERGDARRHALLDDEPGLGDVVYVDRVPPCPEILTFG